MRETHNWIKCDQCKKRLDLGASITLPNDWFSVSIKGCIKVKPTVDDYYVGDWISPELIHQCHYLEGIYCSIRCVAKAVREWQRGAQV